MVEMVIVVIDKVTDLTFQVARSHLVLVLEVTKALSARLTFYSWNWSEL